MRDRLSPDQLTKLLRLEPDLPMEGWQRMLRSAKEAGSPDLWFAVAQRVAAHRPAGHPLQVATVRVALGMGDPAAALQLADATGARDPETLELVARARGTMDPTSAGPSIDAWAASADREGRLRAAAFAAYVGDVPRCRRLYQAAYEDEGPDHEAALGLATLALWALALEEAERLAEPALPHRTARRILAACRVLRGDAAGAVDELDALVAEDPEDGEAHTWRAEALLALGRPEDAVTAASVAMRHARTPSLSARVLRYLATSAVHKTKGSGGNVTYVQPELTRLISAVAPNPTSALDACKAAMEAFGGNRTPGLTWLRDGELARFPVPPHHRSLGRRAQMLIKVRGAGAALGAFDALLAEHGDHPHLRTYRAELLLWLGRYDEAEEVLAGVVADEPETIWAWVGLGAARALLERPHDALATWEEGAATCNYTGPTTWAYRAETYRRLGDLEQAEHNLAEAMRTSPRRLGTWINRALLRAAKGDPTSAATLARELRRLAPELTGPGEAPETLLEHALERMRGNRSSSLVTWFDRRGRLRVLSWSPPDRTQA